MPRKRELIAWALVVTLGWLIIWQYSAASKQEGHAEEAEQRAVIAARHAEQVHFEGNQRVAEAEAVLVRKDAELAVLQARLRAKLPMQVAEKWPSPAPALQPPASDATVTPAEIPPEPTEVVFTCSPIEEKIGIWPVAACKMPGYPEPFGVVPYPAAIRAQELAAQLELTTTKLSATENTLAATAEALVETQRAMSQWKAAAKKSRLKRILSAAVKPAIFIVGVLVGRASK